MGDLDFGPLNPVVDRLNAIKAEAGATYESAPAVGDKGHVDAQTYIARACGLDEDEALAARTLAHAMVEQQMASWARRGEVNLPTALPGLWMDGFQAGSVYADQRRAEGKPTGFVLVTFGPRFNESRYHCPCGAVEMVPCDDVNHNDVEHQCQECIVTRRTRQIGEPPPEWSDGSLDAYGNPKGE